MATRIKVTLDTDQWEVVDRKLGALGLDVWRLGADRVEEIRKQIRLASQGTGEGVPCDCEEVE